MTVTEKPRSDEWVAGDDGPARLALFVDVEGAMKAGARKGDPPWQRGHCRASMMLRMS